MKRRNNRNQAHRERFVQEVRQSLNGIEKATGSLFNLIKSKVHKAFDRYIEATGYDIYFDDWCDENIPAIIDEVEMAKDAISTDVPTQKKDRSPNGRLKDGQRQLRNGETPS